MLGHTILIIVDVRCSCQSMSQSTVTLDKSKLTTAMRRANIESFSELLRLAKVHRNTLHHYFTTKRGVVADPLQRIASVLNVHCLSLLAENSYKLEDEQRLIYFLNQQSEQEPTAAFLLIGSRAKGTARLYSDWDIGIFSGLSKIPVDSYLRMKGELPRRAVPH